VVYFPLKHSCLYNKLEYVSVITLDFLWHPNQSKANPEPIVIYSNASSHAQYYLHAVASSSGCFCFFCFFFFVLFLCVVIVESNYFGFGLRHLIENRSVEPFQHGCGEMFGINAGYEMRIP